MFIDSCCHQSAIWPRQVQSHHENMSVKCIANYVVYRDIIYFPYFGFMILTRTHARFKIFIFTAE